MKPRMKLLAPRIENQNNQFTKAVLFAKDQEMTKASRLIQNTMDAGLIKAVDPETAPRYKKYIPYWV